ncbi:hypothetical protein M9H77_08906 [Catharanthus roseus]|uniref:Uncharacterized protein n=1 Tax=Catharanthus roseus TaxID=4058 RepID=A0ACC0BZ50_CATRO|nr:hypothetical protein M9H77_08906 [Catharanthus roseus]
MVDSSCGGAFLHKTADEAWDLFENLSDNSQQHATSSHVGTSRQIGNRGGMYKGNFEGNLPSHPIENPRANHHEQVKAIITLRNGKLVDSKVGKPIKDSELNDNETVGIDIRTKIERKIEKELASSFNSKTLESSPTASYKPKGDGLMFDICYNFCMTYT